jgi:hypothetical protein
MPGALMRRRVAVWLVEKLTYRQIYQIAPTDECSMIARRYKYRLTCFIRAPKLRALWSPPAATSTQWSGLHVLHQLLKHFAPALRKAHLVMSGGALFGGMDSSGLVLTTSVAVWFER